MKPSLRLALLPFVVVMLVSLGCGGGSQVQPPGPRQHTIVIKPKGNHGQVDNPRVRAGDQVRWNDTSNHSYELQMDNIPGPLVETAGPIIVPTGGPTGWYTVAPRPAGDPRPRTYTYSSKTTQLEGPPDPPGMIVED